MLIKHHIVPVAALVKRLRLEGCEWSHLIQLIGEKDWDTNSILDILQLAIAGPEEREERWLVRNNVSETLRGKMDRRAENPPNLEHRQKEMEEFERMSGRFLAKAARITHYLIVEGINPYLIKGVVIIPR